MDSSSWIHYNQAFRSTFQDRSRLKLSHCGLCNIWTRHLENENKNCNKDTYFWFWSDFYFLTIFRTTTNSTKINRPGHNIRMYYVLNEFSIADCSYMYNKIFLEKLLQKFVLHLFTLLLAPFTPKLVYYSRHSESLKYV